MAKSTRIRVVLAFKVIQSQGGPCICDPEYDAQPQTRVRIARFPLPDMWSFSSQSLPSLKSRHFARLNIIRIRSPSTLSETYTRRSQKPLTSRILES